MVYLCEKDYLLIMQSVSITVDKSKVYEEVAKTTSYIGEKHPEGVVSYERIYTTDDDEQLLERFFAEGTDLMTNLLRRFIVSGTTDGSTGEGGGTTDEGSTDKNGSWTLNLSLSCRYDTNLSASINSSAFSFLVNYIIAKWNEIANKDEYKEYMEAATVLLNDIKEKVFFKKKPTRTAPSASPSEGGIGDTTDSTNTTTPETT